MVSLREWMLNSRSPLIRFVIRPIPAFRLNLRDTPDAKHHRNTLVYHAANCTAHSFGMRTSITN